MYRIMLCLFDVLFSIYDEYVLLLMFVPDLQAKLVHRKLSQIQRVRMYVTLYINLV